MKVENVMAVAQVQLADLRADRDDARAMLKTVIAERDAARAALTQATAKLGAADEQVKAAEAAWAGLIDKAQAERDLAQGQVRVLGEAVRGAEQGREAATAIAAVFRGLLERCNVCDAPPEELLNAIDQALTQTAGLAEAFVQSVRDRWEAKIVEALKGGGDSDELVGKEFCDAWAALMDRARADERARADKLEAFKTYVHGRLDGAGVPADPQPEENAKHGCRIEGRLNYVLMYARTSGLMPTRRAPAGGCWVKCPRCARVGPHFVEAGEAVGYCAQCALGEKVRADLVDCPDPEETPA